MLVFLCAHEKKIHLFFFFKPLFYDKSATDQHLKLLLVSLRFLNHMSAAPNEVCRPSV